MMTHDEMIAVIQHHRDGGKVEFQTRSLGKDSSWEEINEPSWDFHASNYRAKPEPVILWLELDSKGLVIASYKNRTIAQYKGTIKKFTEVTE
jgi:hypothetical protein